MATEYDSTTTASEASTLFDLALSIGQTLDLEECCDRFLSALVMGKGLSHAAVWLKVSHVADVCIPYEHGPIALVHALPGSPEIEGTMPGRNPIMSRLDEEGAFSILADEEGFTEVATEKDVEVGAVTVFPLGVRGFLKLVSPRAEALFAETELDPIREIIGKFTLALEGCLAHQRLKREIVERKVIEEQIRKVNERLGTLVDERTREIQQAQAQLLQSDKMASIGQLAAGVAHEINNPIGFISSNLNSLSRYAKDIEDVISLYESLRKSCAAHSDQSERLEEIDRVREDRDIEYVMSDLQSLIAESIEGTGRVRQIVADLKDFSHVDNPDVTEEDLNELIEKTINVAWNELKYKSEVQKEYGDIPPIPCYGGRLAQVFLNLIVNAAQAIDDQGTITVRSERNGDNVRIQVSDTGCGIPPENLSRIFEPFFTTKAVGAGTGLGLHLTYSIVQAHGGEVGVESTVGEGTTFTIDLPIAGPPAAEES